MPPISGIKYGTVHLLGQKIHRARVRVAHDKKIGVHGVQRHRSIDERFALFDRTGRHRHVHHICPQAFPGNLEAGLSARRGLKEHVYLGHAAQDFRMLVACAIQVNIGFGKVEKRYNFIGS